MQIDESILKAFIGGEVEMRTDGRANWRCETTRFFMNSQWLVAHVAWLAVNRSNDSAERWEKFQHPEFIISLWDYFRPELTKSGEDEETCLIFRHRSIDRVVLFHPPDGERLDPTIVAPIKATFITHSDPPRYM